MRLVRSVRLDGDIEQLAREGKLKGTPGLGSTTSNASKKWSIQGHLAFYDELRATTPQVKLDMLRIPGVGPKKINAIYDQLHVKSIAELEQACNEDKVAHLPGFGKKTQDKILQGIAFLAQHAGRFLYPVAEEEAERIRRRCNVPGDCAYAGARVACGGGGRRSKTSIWWSSVADTPDDDADGAKSWTFSPANPLSGHYGQGRDEIKRGLDKWYRNGLARRQG